MIERGKKDKSSGACETRGTKPGPSTTPPRFICYAPFPLLRLLPLRYAPFPRAVKDEGAQQTERGVADAARSARSPHRRRDRRVTLENVC